jgi:hypothetical protein
VKTIVDGLKVHGQPWSTVAVNVTTNRTTGSLSTVTVPLNPAMTVSLGGEVTRTLDGDNTTVTAGTMGCVAEHAGTDRRSITATQMAPRIVSILTGGR